MASEAPDTPWDPDVLAESVRREMGRTVQRNIKGLEYLASSGPDVGLTAKEVLYRRGTLALYHYLPRTDEVYRVPLLLVMSLVSKSYIFDLAPGQSLVEYLLERGYDVYLIDWGVPRREDTRLRIDDYVLDFMPDCVGRMLEDCGEQELSLLGYCMGGQLAVMYAALFAEQVKNLICIAAPLDSEGLGLFKEWSDPRYFDVDGLVDTCGNVPAELIWSSFKSLRPMSQIADQVRLWDNLWNDEFVASYRRLDRWGNDQIPFPGEAFRQQTKEIVQQNLLMKGEFRLGGRRVDLDRIRASFLNIVAEHDHITPYPAAHPMVEKVGSADKEELVLKGGHVSLLAGRNAMGRLWPRLDRWLSVRSV